MKKLLSILAAFALASTSLVADAAPRHKHGVKAVKAHKVKAKKVKKAQKAKHAQLQASPAPRVEVAQ